MFYTNTCYISIKKDCKTLLLLYNFIIITPDISIYHNYIDFLLLFIDSKEAEAAASAYNTPYNQRGPGATGSNEMPPSYNVRRHLILNNFAFTKYILCFCRICHPATMMHQRNNNKISLWTFKRYSTQARLIPIRITHKSLRTFFYIQLWIEAYFIQLSLCYFALACENMLLIKVMLCSFWASDKTSILLY